MKATLSAAAAALFALCLASAREARADAPPSFAELPVGRLTSPPAQRPGRVAAGEKTPGIFVISRKFPPQVPRAQRFVSLTSEAKIAEASKGEPPVMGPMGASASCMTEVRDFGGPANQPEFAAREWPEQLSNETVAFPKVKNDPSSGVLAVHTERVVEGKGGAASLETVDAWFDPATRGTKLIAKASLPLELVQSSGFGPKVYAGRDERPDGRRFVQFVVVRSSSLVDLDRLGMMFSLRQGGMMAPSQNCAHLRVALAVERQADESASVIMPIALPPLDPAEKAKLASDALAKVALRRAASPPAGPALPGAFEEREVRVREMAIQLSVSQTTRDQAPLVSVSLGWDGRERTQRVPASSIE
jgi:hypothetical protein